jgi:hypothetical protein
MTGPARCPYCRSDLASAASLGCSACGTPSHVACWVEHGGCSILGCASAPTARATPAVGDRIPWAEFVREADPWLTVGAALSWDPLPVPGQPGPGSAGQPGSASDPGSASGSRAA